MMIRTAERRGKFPGGPAATRCSARPNPCWTEHQPRGQAPPPYLRARFHGSYAGWQPRWAGRLLGPSKPTASVALRVLGRGSSER